jgi:hypothetical protein
MEVKQQFENIANAEKLNKRPPAKRQPKDRSKLCFEHECRLHSTLQKDQINLRQSCVTGSRQFCTKELAELRPITVNEMLVPNVHQGRYLMCRTISRAGCLVGISVIVEDLNGDCEEISLYNLTKKLDMNFDEMIPIGLFCFG